MRRQFVSFPKSGRTWLRFAITSLKLPEKITFQHDGFEYNNGAKPPLDFDFQKRLERYHDAGKIVYLSRDPRDVMASLYAQVTGRFADMFKFSGTKSDFLRDPYFGAPNLKEFQRQWDELCNRGVALRVTYEDCHRDFETALNSILSHFELNVPPAAISKASQHASFDNMKELEQAGTFKSAWLRLRNGAPKVRAGKIGGHRNTFSPEDCAYLNKVFEIGDR